MKKLFSVILIITVSIPSLFFLNYQYHPPITNNQKTSEVSSKIDNQLYNGIYSDAVEKTTPENVDNASVYAIERNSAFISMQIALSILLQDQLSSGNKDIYLLYSPAVKDQTVGTYHSEVLPIDGFYEANERFKVIEADLESIPFETDQQIDLYLDDYSYKTNQSETFITDIDSYWSRINSLTFTTDGVAHFGFDDYCLANYNNYSSTEIINAELMMKLLMAGTITTSDLTSDEKIQLSLLLPTMNLGANVINVWAPSYQVYADNPSRINITNSVGTGLTLAYDKLNDENKTLFKSFYPINEYWSENETNFTGKTNYIYSGALMSEDASTVNGEAAIITDLYYYYDIPKHSEINILYKPHPRETDSNLTKLRKQVDTNTNSDSTTWFYIVEKTTPIEAFALTDCFVNNDLTNTSFLYYVFGTSTSVQTLYESEIYSDQIVAYIVNEPSDLATMESWYGPDSTIVDFSKIYDNDYVFSLNNNQLIIITLSTIIILAFAGGLLYWFKFRSAKKI